MNNKSILKCNSLEEWLEKQPDDAFPKYYPNRGEKSYQDKYKDLKKALVGYHNSVELGAMLASIDKWHQELRDEISQLKKVSTEDVDERIKDLEERVQNDPIIYLNQHGVGHVEKVIEKVLEIIKKYRSEYPTASEIFILLCAIQIHDIGNINGREGHETSFQETFRDIAKNIIPDAVTQKNIIRIAQVHSGSIGGSKDTIREAQLQENKTWFTQRIREPMLAALLRFGDELADDSSRYDKIALESNKISERSKIYHEYSKSLHAVNIFDNEINKMNCYVSLEYYVDTKALTVEYPCDGGSILLIDEIFNRTRKMEQERRYCMRFLSPYISLTEIRVAIEIEPENMIMESEKIMYTLSEKGYPSSDIIIDCNTNTGEGVKAYLKEKGWRI
ncbi:MAG: hypothetical protein NC305_14255 [Lachnospiraceae bacterium]|nr:hypothetical protein [Lachnospiraceae bacterium]